MSEKNLTDEELSTVSGGASQGEVKDGKVYLIMPGIASGYTGWYDCDKLEKLANQFASLSSLLAANVTDDMRNGVIELYNQTKRTMPQNVKNILGIK